MIHFHEDLVPPVVIRERAKALRRELTEVEQLLWQKIRKKQLKGIPFRRQVPMGQYILDFYAPSLKLAVELDGTHHQYQKEYDDQRTEWLNRYEITVVRFQNKAVLLDIDEVIATICLWIDQLR